MQPACRKAHDRNKRAPPGAEGIEKNEVVALTREEELHLIDLVLAGEGEAFEGLVLEYQKKIYNLCLRMTRNHSDAEEVAQETFLKAFRSLGSFRRDSSFYVWLYRIASNLCIDLLRREKQRGPELLSLDGGEETERPLELPDMGALPEELLEKKELRAALQAGIDALPARQRQILSLRGLCGLSYSEIAEVLDLEEGTVKSRISRARAALMKHLLENGNLFDGLTSKKTEGR